MSKIDNIIESLRENADGEDIIAYGFVCDTSQNPASAKGFVIGQPSVIAESFAHILEDGTLRKILTKTLSMRMTKKFFNLNEKSNENGHIELN